MDERFSLDSKIIRRSFDKAARGFDTAAVLHREVRQRALERLLLLRQQPSIILDLGAGTGQASHWLKRHYPQAQIIALDSSIGMLREAHIQQTGWRRLFGKRQLFGKNVARIGGDVAALPLRDASIDWVFSNLMLPWCRSPDAAFAEIRRIIKPSGLFSFTSFGPDTLLELRRAWRQVDQLDHVHPFIDMHDLGDGMIRAGFAEPVLDIERFTLTYSDVPALLRDLRATGSCNALPHRARGLTGRAKLAKLTTAYEAMRRDGKLPTTYEVVYGHAWQAPDNLKDNPKKGAQTETKISVESLRGRRR